MIALAFNYNHHLYLQILYSCPKLETILVANNRISSLDVSQLGRLSLLAVLDLQNNAIQSVPPELGNLTQLRSLQANSQTYSRRKLHNWYFYKFFTTLYLTPIIGRSLRVVKSQLSL